jgi:hypothetical protein
MVDIFRNPTKSIPTSDEQIVRVDMESDDIQGRKSHLPAQMKSGSLTISHVPNAGSTPGSK